MRNNFVFICLLLMALTVESRDLNLCLINNLNSLKIDLVELLDKKNSTNKGGHYLKDTVLKDTVLQKPFVLNAICDCNSIAWNWGSVDKAKGYKINFVNDVNSATNLFNVTSFTQQKLVSNKTYNLYVWAYNDSLISEVLHIEARTLPLTCGCVLYDERDNEAYKTVQIGNQCWLGENLRYESETGSTCYYKNKTIVKDYGRYYNFDIALNVCPEGWRLPTSNDINLLLEHYKGGPIELYNYMTDDKNGGLSIKLGGYFDPTCSEKFKFVGVSSGIWVTNPEIGNKAKVLYLYQNHHACQVFDGNKQLKYNVRCIMVE